MASGMELLSMYPITPATSATHYLSGVFHEVGGFVHQAEDEIAAIGFAIVALPACSVEVPEQVATEETVVEQAEPAPSPEAIEAVLLRADEFDGAADHVVGKCPGCNLGMDGKADHKLETAGYELHFCTELCRDVFAESLEEKLVAMKFPDLEEEEEEEEAAPEAEEEAP